MGIAASGSTRQPSPRTLTSQLGQVAKCLFFVLAFWLFSAWIASSFSDHVTLSTSTLLPSTHELVDLSLMVVLALGFLRYHNRGTLLRNDLQAALQEAVLKAESEREKVLAVIEAMGDAISVQDPELNILYQNKAHQQLMGPHLGERCYRAYRGRDEVCAECHLVDAFSDGRVHRVEHPSPVHEGRWFEILASALKDPAGRVTAGIEVVREITDRKSAEQAAQKQAALLQHLIDTIPNPIYYQDPSGRLLWCNAAFGEWLAKPRELLIGRTIAEVSSDQVSLAFARREPTPERATLHEVPLHRGDGALRDVIFYKSRFSEPTGEGGIVGVIVDITERKRAEEEIVGLNAALTQQALELQQANRELEAFSHAISHDLRTPLTKIYSSGQALLDYSGLLDENGLFFVNSVNDGCTQVEALLDALLVLSRVTEVSLSAEQVDLSRMAEEKATQLLQSEPDRRATFRITPRLQVQGDRQLLNIALDNLLGNAWKYTSRCDNPVIELGSMVSGDGELVYFVRDNGAGFDSASAEQLFKPFRRLHSPSDFPGTGLGLATVRRIMRRHGGRVWGEGKPECGATFYFTINV
jgi:PAS domain S-box-containing protein